MQSKMKTEDIDKKIGMPDVDEEWAKFEREVLCKETKTRKRVFVGWTIGIAASIALLAGIFLWGNDAEQQTGSSNQLAQAAKDQTSEKRNVSDSDVVKEDTTHNGQSQEPLSTPREVFENVAANHQKEKPSGELLAQATPPMGERMEEQTPALENRTENIRVFNVVEQQPSFRGGYIGLQEFIKQNLKYPSIAQAYGVSGRVIMQFKIDSLGYISDVKAAKHLLRYDTLLLSRESEARQIELKEQIPQQLEEECARVIALMPRWSPAKISGKVVATETMVAPMMNGGIPDADAIQAAASTKRSPPRIMQNNPSANSRNTKNVLMKPPQIHIKEKSLTYFYAKDFFYMILMFVFLAGRLLFLSTHSRSSSDGTGCTVGSARWSVCSPLSS